MIRTIIARAATTLIVAAACALIAWFVFSWATGATLITFRTGSMAPTMPQGSLAVSLPVDARDIEIGDVITVQREDQSLPVTHRVIEIEVPKSVADPERTLTLQGDDNTEPDMLPYTVTEARRVLGSVAGLGNTIMLLQTPLGMGLLVLVAGTITVWAFWPEKRQPEHALERQRA